MTPENDEALLFQARHFFDTQEKRPLPEDERDLTGKTERIQAIENKAQEQAAQIFAKKLNQLAQEKKLSTNKELGEFLGISEERARVLRLGKHKPQRKTLRQVVDAFDVSIEIFFEEDGF